eukprot:TRINITY_DN1537_c0_g1_i1.p1 TRINITY_DN1537_c0_g1~~TRINITY_DN1537_c0_g1_i1.p1  ORF type:complete len:607 (-),score=52.56 TRINITY_DN1537_c0_g1_i1:989-2809(-)
MSCGWQKKKQSRYKKWLFKKENVPVSDISDIDDEDMLILKKTPNYLFALDDIEIIQMPYNPGENRAPNLRHDDITVRSLGISTGLLYGEVVVYEPKFTVALLVEDRIGMVRPVYGHLRLTNYKLNFIPQKVPPNIPKAYRFEVNIPVHSIRRVLKRGAKFKDGEEKFYCLQIRTKYFVDIILAIPAHDKERVLMDKIIEEAFTSEPVELAAFRLGVRLPQKKQDQDLIVAEYNRQKIYDKVRISNANYDPPFSLCETYPPKILVPASVSDAMLRKIAKFRSRGRIPVLTFFRKYNGSCLYRCAQPLVGIKGSRCDADENFINTVINDSFNDTLVIADCRPKLNARVNQIMGKGFESERKYSKIELKFMEIENIHAMRDSLKKLRRYCLDTDNEIENDSLWNKALESSKWAKHLRKVMEGVQFMAWHVNEGRSVICHCSDGWDRTAQVCSLTQMILDPFFRTVRGLKVIIEKDWLHYGHRFQLRSGHGNKKYKDSEMSPIFLQFLDCVWQLLHQFPKFFEYSENLLVMCATHVYSCRFGTFLFDCEKQRAEAKVKQRTESFWDFLEKQVASNRSFYINPEYEETESVLLPNPKFLKLWKSFYLFWRL